MYDEHYRTFEPLPTLWRVNNHISPKSLRKREIERAVHRPMRRGDSDVRRLHFSRNTVDVDPRAATQQLLYERRRDSGDLIVPFERWAAIRRGNREPHDCALAQHVQATILRLRSRILHYDLPFAGFSERFETKVIEWLDQGRGVAWQP